jgi:hypothetical protein
MEAPWSWTTAAAVVSASVGCALSLKRMLGKGQVEHEDHPGEELRVLERQFLSTSGCC